MGRATLIEWADHTFNPWVGCTKVSAGCKNCYAEALMDHRYGKVQWGPLAKRQRTSDANWRKPVQWNKESFGECPACGWRGKVYQSGQRMTSCPACLDEGQETKLKHARARVFCSSLADVFEGRPEVDKWRMQLFNMIIATPNLDWMLLTKRPENIIPALRAIPVLGRENVWDHLWVGHDGMAWKRNFPHVWIGTSVEDQDAADKRIPELLEIPAAVRFVSCEPLLGPVRLDNGYTSYLSCNGKKVNGECCESYATHGDHFRGIDWVIAGGESGSKARPMHPSWARSLRDQCQEAGVPYLFKQWGEWAPAAMYPNQGSHWTYVGQDKTAMRKVGKKVAGRQLDGREWNEFPNVNVF